ncbi:hypothetical protein [Hymenobacter antarcticus]|uniref:DUF4440 domain-containing protein n=1 Tax=Hymenobacter antarcticus TaxID=486270 RepID=A0ABP7P2U7_9BACT
MFSQRLIIGAAGLLTLGAGASAQAQSTTEETTATTPQAARYTAAHDSVLARAAACRSENEKLLRDFSASFIGIRGLRRKIVSFNSIPFDRNGRTVLKTHIIKHKTTGAKVEKIDYRAQDGKLLLSERYIQGQLVRLEVFEYTPIKNLLSGMRQSGSWLLLPGDYIQRTRKPEGKAKTSAYYFRTRPTTME